MHVTDAMKLTLFNCVCVHLNVSVYEGFVSVMSESCVLWSFDWVK